MHSVSAWRIRAGGKAAGATSARAATASISVPDASGTPYWRACSIASAYSSPATSRRGRACRSRYCRPAARKRVLTGTDQARQDQGIDQGDMARRVRQHDGNAVALAQTPAASHARRRSMRSRSSPQVTACPSNTKTTRPGAWRRPCSSRAPHRWRRLPGGRKCVCSGFMNGRCGISGMRKRRSPGPRPPPARWKRRPASA